MNDNEIYSNHQTPNNVYVAQWPLINKEIEDRKSGVIQMSHATGFIGLAIAEREGGRGQGGGREGGRERGERGGRERGGKREEREN